MSEAPKKDDLDITKITTQSIEYNTKTYIERAGDDNDKDILNPPYILEINKAKPNSTYFVRSLNNDVINVNMYNTNKIYITDENVGSSLYLKVPYYLEPTKLNRFGTAVESLGSKLSNQFRRKSKEEVKMGGQKVQKISQKTSPYKEEKISQKFPQISFMYFLNKYTNYRLSGLLSAVSLLSASSRLLKIHHIRY